MSTCDVEATFLVHEIAQIYGFQVCATMADNVADNGVCWRSCVTMRKLNKFWGFGKKGERVTSLNEHVLIARIAIMRDDEIAFFARKESFVRV